MDYIIENSNISVSGTDLIPVESHSATIPPNCIANVDQFITNQATIGSSTVHSPTVDGNQVFSNSPLSIGSMRNQKPRMKSKAKSLHKAKTFGVNQFRSTTKERQSISSPTIGSINRASSVIANVSELNGSLQNVEDALANDENQNNDLSGEHRALYLPKFREPKISMWTASHAANCPSEDRSASLVNLLLQPLPPNFDSETQLMPLEPDYKVLIRLSLWVRIF